MDFKNYEEAVVNMPLYDDPVLGLAGEVGEVLELIKKDRRLNDRRKPIVIDDLTKELGDVLWYLTRIAANHNISMADVASENIKKLNKRHNL